MDLIKQPPVQLGIYLSILFLTTIVSRLNSGTVIQYGISSLLIWIFVATLAGISSDYNWLYYAYLTGCLLFGYLIFWACWLITEKFGEPYRGDGSLVAIAPLTVGPFLLIVSLLIKLIWHFIALSD